jgi:hypothetical protein
MTKNILVIFMIFLFFQFVSAKNSTSCSQPPLGGKVDENCTAASIQNPSSCLNKSVLIVAKPDKYESIKNLFMLLSHLPYDVKELKKEKTKTLISISYWGDGPNSLALSARVGSILESKFSEFGIQSIRAEFDPRLSCK